VFVGCQTAPDGEVEVPPDTVDTVDTVDDIDTVDDKDTDVVVPDTDDDPPVEPEGVDYTMTTSGVITCATPAARDAGAYELVHAQALEEPDPVPYRLTGGGIAVSDFDDNGLLDVLIVGADEVALQMQDAPGIYREEGRERLGGLDLSDASAASAADYDGDGDLDLFVTRYQQPNVLLDNDGYGYFSDATVRSEIRGTHRSQTSSWGDMDNDGDLDLFVGNYGPKPDSAFADELEFEVADPSQLWENLGDGTFLDRSDVIPDRLHNGYTFMSSWDDVDLDGDVDLMVINDFGWSRPSQLLWNTPAGLVPDDGSAGFDIDFAGMGLGIGDINHDEIPDFLQSSWKETSLLVSRPGFWVEEAPARGLVPAHDDFPRQIFGWGAELVDVDNDGDDDAVINYGFWDEYGRTEFQEDGLFVQQDDGTFVDEALHFDLNDPSPNRGLVAVDINDDGSVDLLRRRLGRSTPMYLSRCNDNAWLRVRPRQSTGLNRFAVGARVRFVGPERVWSKSVHAGGRSMYASHPPEVHVGLGMLERLDRVEVIWPDGEKSVIEDVQTKQILDVVRD
jgi:hypothetical protein